MREGLLKGKTKTVAWVAAGVVVFTAIWTAAVAMEVDIDARSFRGLGYSNPMALSLALLTTVLFCVIGILLSDLVGLTHMIPAISDMSRTRRAALIGSVGLVFLIAASQLPRIAQYRSEPIALQVQAAQTARLALKALPLSQRPAFVVNETDRQLAAAKARLATARYADDRLAIGAAALEAVTSWAVAWSLLLAACLCAGVVAVSATRKAEAATAAVGIVNQRFFARIAALAVDLEIDRDEVVAALRAVQVTEEPPPTIEMPPDAPATPSGAEPTVTEPAPPEETVEPAVEAEPTTTDPDTIDPDTIDPDAIDPDANWNFAF